MKRSLLRMVAIATLVFAATAINSSAQTLTTLYNFCSQANCADGASPVGTLVQGSDGDFYGVTGEGGAYGWGAVFKFTRSGDLTVLYSFCPQGQYSCPDGAGPNSLVRAADGNFYGTTGEGGVGSWQADSGTVFKITPAGILTTLHTFCLQPHCPDGRGGNGLMQASDGNFYGAAFEGGPGAFSSGACEDFGCGTIFKITPSGTFTTLYAFCPQGNCLDGGPDGANPGGSLVQAPDGNFYGTTGRGGNIFECTFGCGTAFKISPAGALTTLHTFCSQQGCPDGVSPDGLIQAPDGNFYGTAAVGGLGLGTVFRMAPDGQLMTVHTFDGSDGGEPGLLIQATDGNFYGVTGIGGSGNCTTGCGTIFKIAVDGALTTLHNFQGTDGLLPNGRLLQGTDGIFYGVTGQGGSQQQANCPLGCGTVFKLSTDLSPFVATQPTSGSLGTPVTILGSNLTGATSVTFNGTPATINSNTGSAITTNVPAGATTGVVQVTTPSGTLTSNADFQISGPLQFIPVTPCRLADTRETHNPIQSGTSQNFTVPQLGTCGIPTSIAAYSLNVTVVPHGPLGYLTIWPDGEVQPVVSTMNSLDGRTKANAAITPSGNNAVSVFASNTTDLVLDIDGYFTAPGAQTSQFYSVIPCRVIDTRFANGHLGSPSLTGQVERDFPVPQSPCIPQGPDIKAYSFNVTVVPTPQQPNQPLGYLTVWPKGEPQPNVSTLNNLTATTVANGAIVPAGMDGAISVFASNNTDLVVDINGYFAAPGTGGLSLYPTAPCRVLDTRDNNGQPFVGPTTVNVVGSVCAPPASAQAFVLNATVVPPEPLGYLTLWPDGQQQPSVSTLNALDGFITSNMAIVPTMNGSIDAFASNLTQLVLDISSYFAP